MIIVNYIMNTVIVWQESKRILPQSDIQCCIDLINPYKTRPKLL